MNLNKFHKMDEWFDTQITIANDEIQRLTADNREDEAVFIKIRKNILDIFKTILSVSVRNGQTTPEFFMSRLDQIPQNWRSSLLAAQAHGDAEKAHLEQLKLATAAEIRNTFVKIMEGEV